MSTLLSCPGSPPQRHTNQQFCYQLFAKNKLGKIVYMWWLLCILGLFASKISIFSLISVLFLCQWQNGVHQHLLDNKYYYKHILKSFLIAKALSKFLLKSKVKGVAKNTYIWIFIIVIIQKWKFNCKVFMQDPLVDYKSIVKFVLPKVTRGATVQIVMQIFFWRLACLKIIIKYYWSREGRNLKNHSRP